MKAYRCLVCGKWSHAQRKPKRHQRYVRAEPLDKSLLIEYDPGQYDHMNGFTVEPSWRIWCGPFVTYTVIEGDLEWRPTKWWRSTCPDGTLWGESSDEEEIRRMAHKDDTIWNLWILPEVMEWREDA